MTIRLTNISATFQVHNLEKSMILLERTNERTNERTLVLNTNCELQGSEQSDVLVAR